VRTYDKDINKRIDTMSKEWETYSGSPNSYGGSTVVGFESQALYNAPGRGSVAGPTTLVYQAIKDGKDPVQAMNKLWTNSNHCPPGSQRAAVSSQSPSVDEI
jgi:hypothetical protein